MIYANQEHRIQKAILYKPYTARNTHYNDYSYAWTRQSAIESEILATSVYCGSQGALNIVRGPLGWLVTPEMLPDQLLDRLSRAIASNKVICASVLTRGKSPRARIACIMAQAISRTVPLPHPAKTRPFTLALSQPRLPPLSGNQTPLCTTRVLLCRNARSPWSGKRRESSSREL